MTDHRSVVAGLACLAVGLAAAGCGKSTGPAGPGAPPASRWRLERLGQIDGFQVPECVLVDREADAVYVSNIEAAPGNYWSDDGNGFLSLLDAEGILNKRRWKDSTAQARLNAPKGMCVVAGMLYVADNTRVMTFSLADGKAEPIEVPGAQKLNDMCAHGGFAYVSDTAAGKIHKLSVPVRTLPAPASVNGITFDANGRMFAVSRDLHDIFEIDPQGQQEPKPFGLAEHFTHPDGIEVLHDGTFLVSDFGGNRLLEVSPDRKAVFLLAEMTTPADIGLDRRRLLLYVPSLQEGKVVLFKLTRR